jgi:hypothetical protein
MGLFKKLKELAGSPDKDLMQNGQLGRGQVVGVEQTNVSTGSDAHSSPVCVFTVDVMLDNTPAFRAQCRQAVPMMVLPQLSSGQAIVAVRVNPEDHNQIALDLNTEPPEVTVARDESGLTAADILAAGADVRAVIVQSQDMGMKNPEGVDIHGFLLTVMQDGAAPRQVQIGLAVPPEAVPLLFPGSNVPAKVVESEPDSVIIDWKAALAEFAK